MNPIEKKHLKRMACPKCSKLKLRFKDGSDGVRCDACKSEIAATDPGLVAERQRVEAEMTPAPVAPGHQRY